MAWPTGTDLTRIRLLCGVDATRVSDFEVGTLFEYDTGGNVYLTAALVCEAAAALPATGITSWSADGVSVSRGGNQSDMLLAQAARLRAFAAGGIGSIALSPSWDTDEAEFG